MRTRTYWSVAGVILGVVVSTTGLFGGEGDEKSRQEQAPVVTPLTHKPADGTTPAKIAVKLVRERKHYFMNGNKISTEIYDYGGVGPGYGLIRGVNNVVWHNLSYVFQFCPIVGASVPDGRDPSRRIHIISDGLNDYPGYQEISPSGDTLWQWQPLAGYSEAGQPLMASNPAVDNNNDGKPDSWPRTWYNPTLGKYVWPGYLSQDVPSADLEVFWAMDDRDNSEFPYYPFPFDSTRRGLGVQIDGRAFQWSNALAENTIFFVYTITNTSQKDLDTVLFGIYGDADVGGGSPENVDDRGDFIPPYDSSGRTSGVPVYSRSLVYFFDDDMVGDRGLPLGYVGCKFLESPGNPNDLIDNDGDGIVDERQDDGIDNDHDWNPITDDTGIDGIPNTFDPGEGDGAPTAGIRLPDGSLDPLHPGELNFELTDLDEADQIGLTSFNSWSWSPEIFKDESIWFRNVPRSFSSIPNKSDIVFVFGSGYISLTKAETKRISMALLLGENKDDLLTSAKTVQTIYNQNYRFFKPPLTPHMTAVPDDKKVTLYWDTHAEESLDPITGKDFEGYVIYRSTDPSFNDIQKVTDGKGAQFLCEPLTSIDGDECKWDVDKRDEPFTDLNRNGKWDTGEPFVDLTHDGLYSIGYDDPWKGYSPVPYQDRGTHYYLGNNRGIVHSYVDSNNVINGQTYYYAVVAFDHGDSVGIPPTETTKKITVDPITSKLTFDVNTAQVIPGPRASGYVAPAITSRNVTHETGIGTGNVDFSILNDLEVKEGNEYLVSFGDSVNVGTYKIKAKNYSVLNLLPASESFQLFDTNYVALRHSMISDDTVLRVTDRTGNLFTRGSDYVVNMLRGSIRRTGSGMRTDSVFNITYRYYPVFESRSLLGNDENPAFEGVKLKITDEAQLGYDSLHSAWIEGNCNFDFEARLSSIGARKALYPADYEFTFSSQYIDSAVALANGIIKIPVKFIVRKVTGGAPVRIQTFVNDVTPTKNKLWDPGEEIALFQPGSAGAPTDTLTWGVVITRPSDTSKTPVYPTDGDKLLIRSTRPFNSQDSFRLRTQAGAIDAPLASSQLDNIYVVPNPYVGVNDIEPANRLPSETRGERRIYFEHLPPLCTIRIFTVSGDLVQTLRHESGLSNGREFWNLLNRDGFGVAYGVYVAHIDAPGIGEKIIKFALIK